MLWFFFCGALWQVQQHKILLRINLICQLGAEAANHKLRLKLHLFIMYAVRESWSKM